MDDDFNPIPGAVFLKTRSDEAPLCLPGNVQVLREILDVIPDEIIIGKEFLFCGWETIVAFRKELIDEVLEYLYGDGIPEAVYGYICGDVDDEIKLLGYWD